MSKHRRHLHSATCESISCSWADQHMTITFEGNKEIFVIHLEWWAVVRLVEKIRESLAAEISRGTAWMEGIKRRVGL